MIQETEKIVHLAAQYLAAANINFVEKESDDSHTNFGLDVKHLRLMTHTLSPEGDQLAFNYNTFALEWISPKNVTVFPLEGKLHPQVLEWLQQMTTKYLNKPYTYSFHYDLPYAIDAQYRFHIKDTADLLTLAKQRTLAQRSLDLIVKDNNLEATIRIWPHHFDTGIYATLSDMPELAVGLGLAIPDSVSDTHYLYASGYKNGDGIDPVSFPPLALGRWISNSFKGAIIPIDNHTEAEAVQFFKEALEIFKR